MEVICYEFASRAVAIYETFTDSKTQFRCLQLIIGALQAMGRATLSEDNYETLVGKAAQHAAHLVLKPDQARSVFLCSHLAWTGTAGLEDGAADAPTVVHDEKRVLQCLQKSLKIGSECMDGSPEQIALYVDILEEYLYFFAAGNTAVTPKYINGLLQLIDGSVGKLDIADPTVASIQAHYRGVREHIARKTADGTWTL
eukprot:Amastigsp_a5002_10.p3 type:complete len:199 gc:universal Amastigsp_a5002_10:1-597(+)